MGSVFLVWCYAGTGWSADWLYHRSDDFLVIYQSRYQFMIPHILQQAQTGLGRYRQLYQYEPNDRITLIIRDSRDIAAAAATTFPHNTIKMDIAPASPDYEFTFQHQHFQWLTSHELMHIVVNDQHGQPQTTLRPLLGKAAPVSEDPLTLFFSLLTNPNRFTPLWFQEGIAIFCETWLNKGGGRVFSSFDEMYFRTLIHDHQPLLEADRIDGEQENHFLLETLSYLYGSRFISWLAWRYSPQQVNQWYSHKNLFCYKKKFKKTFAVSLQQGWKQFKQKETAHQQKNINRVKQTPLTTLDIRSDPMGWTSQPYIDGCGRHILFACHRSHELASLKRLDLKTNRVETVASLPTPALLNVTSTAYDSTFDFFFYTTQNTRGFRDLWAIDIRTKQKKLIFRNSRMGDLAIDPQNHALWGVQMHNGLNALAVSPFPYRKISTLFTLPVHTTLCHLAVSPDGRKMAAILKHGNGLQKLILIDMQNLIDKKTFVYETIAKVGNPEHPNWSKNGSRLYWNAFTTGVANIYRRDKGDDQNRPVSNVVSGLFRPCALSDTLLFAFLFTPDGFQPVTWNADAIEGIKAIRYMGQAIVDKHPAVKGWALAQQKPISDTVHVSPDKPYRWWRHLHRSMTVPMVAASGREQVIGLTAEFRDHLLEHRLFAQIGMDRQNRLLHMVYKYSYRDLLKMSYRHNAATFYDLVNNRQTALEGKRAMVEYKKWWVYDLPTQIEQWTTLLWGQGLTDIEPESYEINQANLIGLKTRIGGQHLRKRIGSVQFEKGYKWNIDLLWTQAPAEPNQQAWLAAADFTRLWDGWWPHHVLRTKLAGGSAFGRPLSLGRFFFGGFGNRILEELSMHRFRDVSSLPGLDYKRLISDRFVKLHLETTLPPLSVPLQFYKTRCRKSTVNLFTMALLSRYQKSWKPYFSCGIQCDILLRHFFTVDSSFSVGLARAWSGDEHFDQLMLSFKLFRQVL